MGAGTAAPVLRPWSPRRRVVLGLNPRHDRGMEFESWIRDQLESGSAPGVPAAPPRAAGRRLRVPALQAAAALAALSFIAGGVANGGGLPVFTVRVGPPSVQQVPVATWGGRPELPQAPGPGRGESPAAPASAPAGGTVTSVARPGSGRPAPAKPTSSPIADPSPDDRREKASPSPNGGGPRPGASPVPGTAPSPSPSPSDDHGGRGPGGPRPSPSPSPSSRD
jgi:hypothetical protein